MSYCRFDKDSDVCAYNDGESIIIDVARRRPTATFDDDILDALPMAETLRYIQANSAPIGLPFDGAHYSSPNAVDAINRLLGLRDAGYVVPEDAIDQLKREASLPPRATPAP